MVFIKNIAWAPPRLLLESIGSIDTPGISNICNNIISHFIFFAIVAATSQAYFASLEKSIGTSIFFMFQVLIILIL